MTSHTDYGPSTATTQFDGNGRPIRNTAIDGTVTLIGYDPLTGLAKNSIVAMDGGTAYAPGDRETVTTYDGSGGSTVTVLGSSGNTVDTQAVSNGGLDTSQTINGLTTSTHVALSSSGETDTTTNPDGTRLAIPTARECSSRRRRWGRMAQRSPATRWATTRCTAITALPTGPAPRRIRCGRMGRSPVGGFSGSILDY